jgi:hypothetical protein
VPAHQFIQVHAAGGKLVAGVVHLPAVANLHAGMEAHPVAPGQNLHPFRDALGGNALGRDAETISPPGLGSLSYTST